MAPKRLPIVSTGAPTAHAAAVPPTSATTVPGMTRTNRFTRRIVASAPLPTATDASESVSRCRQTAAMRSTNSPTFSVTDTPRNSLICVLAMSTAIPLVKPMITGRGMNFTAVPDFDRPSRINMTPAIIVHMKRPWTPNSAMMPDTTTTNAPVGPPICVRDPPIAEIRNPVTIAQ